MEFQGRGAAHLHGCGWLDLLRLAMLVWRDGHLSHPTSDTDEDDEKPLKEISTVFKKLRHNATLEKEDLLCLKTFVDEFVTVSTDPETVGEDVAEIVTEVNQHHHTKTCRKRSSECRFNFPKVIILVNSLSMDNCL